MFSYNNSLIKVFFPSTVRELGWLGIKALKCIEEEKAYDGDGTSLCKQLKSYNRATMWLMRGKGEKVSGSL